MRGKRTTWQCLEKCAAEKGAKTVEADNRTTEHGFDNSHPLMLMRCWFCLLCRHENSKIPPKKCVCVGKGFSESQEPRIAHGFSGLVHSERV